MVMMSIMPLSPKEKLFVKEYLVDLNASAAYRRAGYVGKNANVNSSQILAKPSIQAAIQEEMATRSRRTEITVDAVLKSWWELANADPNELIEVRRTCCRHCYGVDNQWQRTQREIERDRIQWERSLAPAKPTEFQELGGVWYDPRKPPFADCPECFGEGERQVFAKDTRMLSPQARRLYAGVKETKDGIEIKMRDQDEAMLNVAKHLGMFTQKAELKLTDERNPADDLTDDEADAELIAAADEARERQATKAARAAKP